MVNLTRIYTRTGDDGTTALGDNSRTNKSDSRLVAYADVDESNCALGLVLGLSEPPEPVADTLARIQNELFDVGADLSTPLPDPEGKPRLRITEAYTKGLEADCDSFNADLPALRSFVLPGGTPSSALLHQARAITRRAERSAWLAAATHGETINPECIKYLNRLSDLLFILARYCNNGQDVLWQPGSER